MEFQTQSCGEKTNEKITVIRIGNYRSDRHDFAQRLAQRTYGQVILSSKSDGFARPAGGSTTELLRDPRIDTRGCPLISLPCRESLLSLVWRALRFVRPKKDCFLEK